MSCGLIHTEAVVVLAKEEHDDESKHARAGQHPVDPEMANVGDVWHEEKYQTANVHAVRQEKGIGQRNDTRENGEGKKRAIHH